MWDCCYKGRLLIFNAEKKNEHQVSKKVREKQIGGTSAKGKESEWETEMAREIEEGEE